MALFDRNDRAGSVAVEMAVVLPLVLLVIVGLMEFGRVLWTQATLDYAVEAAARCAVVNSVACGSTAQTQAYAVDRAAGLTLSPSTFSVATTSCGLRVSASLPVEFIAPGLLPYAITLTATACYPS
jgi:Flp pilus assembly protein TadG